MRGQRQAPAALYPREKPGTLCTGCWVGPRAGLNNWGKSRPTGILSPDRPAHSQSLYRMNYPAHRHVADLLITAFLYFQNKTLAIKPAKLKIWSSCFVFCLFTTFFCFPRLQYISIVYVYCQIYTYLGLTTQSWSERFLSQSKRAARFVLECRVFQPTHLVRNNEKIRWIITVIRRGQIKCLCLRITGNLPNRCGP